MVGLPLSGVVSIRMNNINQYRDCRYDCRLSFDGWMNAVGFHKGMSQKEVLMKIFYLIYILQMGK